MAHRPEGPAVERRVGPIRWLAGIDGLVRLTVRQAAASSFLVVLVLLFAGLIGLGGEITLFGFGEERSMLREMGLASLRLFGMLVVLIFGLDLVPGDRRTGRLSAWRSGPLGWTGYLLGRYLGLVAVILLPTLVLVGAFTGSLKAEGAAVDGALAQAIGLGGLQVLVVAAVGMFCSVALPRVAALPVAGLVWLGAVIRPGLAARLKEGMGDLGGWLVMLPLPDLSPMEEAAGAGAVLALGLYLLGYLSLTVALLEGWELT